MSAPQVFAAARATSEKRPCPAGEFVQRKGEPFYHIANYDAMEPFFMTIVSSSDHYLFLSSNGGLTAGRRNPDYALFPYYTDDRIHDSAEHTGSKTIIRVYRDDKVVVWEPFSIRGQESSSGSPVISRNLYKSAYGNRVVFEEINHSLNLSFTYEWATSDRFGFVRSVQISNRGDISQRVDVLDGLQNLLPCGVTRRFQLEYSTLVDGYKHTELDVETGLAILQLTSIPVDRPEPSEALQANVAWSTGLTVPTRLISSVQLDRFRQGKPLATERENCGRRGAYFVGTSFEIPPNASREWKILADVKLDTSAVHDLAALLRSNAELSQQIEADIASGTENLIKIVAAADGIQKTRNEVNDWHHFASALFNVMRGGIPDEHYSVRKKDFLRFVKAANSHIARKHKKTLAALPEKFLYKELLARARETNDSQFERICHEYLPLTFSRRHGDPSRPWNIFDIKLKDEHGNRILNYQGNWRDIFQNWEALGYSYPQFVPSMIFKFLDSSTADGYNPYRISRDGYDWEVVDPHDAWSFIGYWGDHQIIYLLRLLELSRRSDPDVLNHLLLRRLFTFANVPYRIKAYEELLRTPQDTIEFDAKLNRRIHQRTAKMGADGKALAYKSGELVCASLVEKLFIPLLTKLSNFIPGAGIWLNTQRPEWNDANNALVGSGASMVTLYHLRRYVQFLHDLLANCQFNGVDFSIELAEFFEGIEAALAQGEASPGTSVSDEERKRSLDQLGNIGSKYRQHLYSSGFSGELRDIPVRKLQGFCALAIQQLDRTIRENQREDGLYHSYNLADIRRDRIGVQRLPLMLEGQVAVLSCGALSLQECDSLLQALRTSALYRPDQNTYMLYPVRHPRSFLAKNNIPQHAVAGSRLLSELIRRGDRSIVDRDHEGNVHFCADFRNVHQLQQSLTGFKDRALASLAKKELEEISAIYESVFQHRCFTGRSASLYKYEGVGCIYWHMVSKLLLAAREVLGRAAHSRADRALIRRLQLHCENIQAGLGPHKTPGEYGAVPVDPYSHTPFYGGAQQPGMTGQAKEDFIARLNALGIRVCSGEIWFQRSDISGSEYVGVPAKFNYRDLRGNLNTLELEQDSFAFTFCQVPIVVHANGPEQMIVRTNKGSSEAFPGLRLCRELSREVFDRSGVVQRLDVFLGSGTPSNLADVN